MHFVDFFVVGVVCDSHNCEGTGSPGDERLGGVHE